MTVVQQRLFLLLSLAAFPAAAAPLNDTLEAKRHQWQSANIQSYTYHYQRPCACQKEDRSLFAIRVIEGAIAEVMYIQPDSNTRTPIAEAQQHWYPTIDDLFDRLVQAQTMDAARIEAAYHPLYGYPVWIYIDYNASTTDDDMDIRVNNLQVLK